MTCYPSADRIGRGLTALVRVDCPVDRATAVAAELARHPQAASIELVTGGADLPLTVAAYDHGALTAHLLRPRRPAHPHRRGGAHRGRGAAGSAAAP
ncbi:Lrp/AsnC family transcriptional regulator [Kitasatospora griseola]|uniref:Lrp/AsnC family transcriptional regulator n=1 Tax=Kitasatospora griseola TaxID=2064 RepID=UPI00167044D0|nr:Lrp/AsnC family transcriptional regulator [Kitasatospora griseola]GGQ71624.1 hypothetical protein GCM10010195_29070 [Kitasatospora griseola]